MTTIMWVECYLSIFLFYDGNYIECEVEVSKALQYFKIYKSSVDLFL
jgi:hypothetical protein